MSIEVLVLGPLEARLGGRSLEFEAAKQRQLFTLLAIDAGRVVTVDRLIEGLWGSDPPAGTAQALQKHVSRLRTRLGDAAPLRRRPPGYVLEIDRDAVDAHRFEAALQRGREALARGDPAGAAEQLRAALAMWRGPVLAEQGLESVLGGEIARLEELRLQAVEERIAADLALGVGGDLVGELRALVNEHPLRERLRMHLMLALYRAGRQAEALEAMRDARRRLVEELGLEPGPELRRLERMILVQDPELDAATAPTRIGPPLPVHASALVGREREVEEVRRLLLRPDVRLVTLTGPGGAGKSRLALHVAGLVHDDFPAGAVHVDVQRLDAPELLALAAAEALGLVAATPEELAERLRRATRGTPILLLLDGFEGVLEAAPAVGELLAATPGLTVLAASRAALRLTSEHTYAVGPLEDEAALELFRVRATAANPECRATPEKDATIAEICRRLDGLPLAIELAAEQLRALDPETLLSRLERRLEVLTDGPRDLPPRQRSLRATLDWSWAGLDEAERTLLCRLTVFDGGASLEAAGAICGELPGGLQRAAAGLLGKAMLRRTDTEPRLSMLGTIREYAAERAAEREDVAALRARHAEHFLAYGELAAERATHARRREWLERMARERANVRAAFEWMLGAGRAEEALRLAIAFARALPWDAHTQEVRGWLQGALARPGSDPRLRAQARYWDGELAILQSRFGEALVPLQGALAAARELADRRLEAAAQTALARRATLVGAPEARAVGEESVAAARAVADDALLGDALLTMVGACERERDWDAAARLAAESLSAYERADDPNGIASALAELGWQDVVHGRHAQAEIRLGEAVRLRRSHGDERGLTEPLASWAWLAVTRNDTETATRRFLDCLALSSQLEDAFVVGEALAGLAATASLTGEWRRAARLAGASAAVYGEIGARPWESVTAMHERRLLAARVVLGDERFAVAFDEGRSWPAEEALAFAIAGDGEARHAAPVAG